MIFSIPFADHSGQAFNYVLTIYYASMIIFYLVVANVDTTKELKSFMMVLSGSVMFYAGMTLILGGISGNRLAVGTMYDPNDLAYFLVSLFPFFFLAFRKEGYSLIKIMAILGCVTSSIAILFTSSRGGLLGFLIILFYIFFGSSFLQKKSQKFFVVLLVGVVFIQNINKIDFDRFRSITDLSSDYNITSETGRLDLWKRAWRLTLSNPVTGVGPTCSARAIGYQRMAEGNIPMWQPVHNSYLQVLVETGFLGFIVFSCLIIRTMTVILKSSKIISKTDDQIYWRSLASVMKPGFIASLVAAFFLTQAYSGIFTLFFALGAVIERHIATNTSIK